MPDAADLRRRMDAAIRNPRLHPGYARQLLREARAALGDEPPAEPETVVVRAWCAARFGVLP
jgi:hypothetical protein